jgi:lysozyme family protein
MATVPMLDAPSQSLDAAQMPNFTAAGVEPMKNFAPEQMQKMGSGMTAAGTTLMKIGQSIQNDLDDANTKAMVTSFSANAQAILMDKDAGYLTTAQGKMAKDRYASTQEAMLKARKDAEAGLENEFQKKMFTQAVDRQMLQFKGQMDLHAVKEVRQYEKKESEAFVNNAADLAIKSYGSRDQKDATGRVNNLYTSNVATGLQTIVDDFAKDGIAEDSEQVKQAKQKFTGYVATGAVTDMMLNNKFIEARKFLDGAYKSGDVDSKTAQTLYKQIDAGYNKEVATGAGDKIFSSRGPTGTDFDSAANWTMSKDVEGEYVADDAGKGPTKYGINGSAYFGVAAKDMTDSQKNFIANLTPEKAKEIYRKNYWDKIDADKLDPRMRAIAFDTAVNQGPEMAKRLLAEAGNDPEKLIELRRAEYKKLIKSNPEKFAQYEKGWMSRLDKLEASITGTRSLSGMLTEADQIQDPEVREMTRQRIKNKWSEDEAIKREDYTQKTMDAWSYVDKKGVGGWRDIPAPLWADMKPEDKARLMNPTKADDPSTLFELEMNPDLWNKDDLAARRGLLTESTFRKYYMLGETPEHKEKIVTAKIDATRFKDLLNDAGMSDIATPKGKERTEEAVKLKVMIQDAIIQEQKIKKRDLQQSEKDEIIKMMIKPVKIRALHNWMPSGWDSTTDEVNFYKVKNSSNVIIPEKTRDKIIADFQKNGVAVNEKSVLAAYLRMEN